MSNVGQLTTKHINLIIYNREIYNKLNFVI